jgi:hypothetical protein
MSATSTRTRTTSFTRTEFLVRQLDFVVRSTTGSTSFAEVMRKGAANRWIRRVTIEGLTSSGEIAQEICFTIDWDEHQLHLDTPSGAVIHVDPSVPEGEWLAHAIGMVIEYFNEIQRDASLTATWSVQYTASADRAYVNRELGLGPAPPRRWAGGRAGAPVLAFRSLPNFSELGMEYRVASD